LQRWYARAEHWLEGIGRQATRWLAAGIFLGVLVPPLAAGARPLLTPAIFVLMAVTVLRLDPAAVVASLRRPLPLALAVLWLLVGTPLLVLAPAALLGGGGFLGDHAVLVAASAPVISVVAYAVLLGLDAAFALAAGVVATALVPFTLPILAGVVVGVDLPLDPGGLLARLVLLIGGAAGVAVLLRRWWGPATVAERGALVDGVAVMAMLTFGLAVMDGVTAAALDRPGFTARALVLVFALAIGLNLVGTLLFAPFGRRLALTVGLMSGFKNFGLVVAAMGAAADGLTVVFLGLVQFPIYLLPVALRRLARRRLARGGETP
jgi:bile acid:Na+ symporter, BASS family